VTTPHPEAIGLPSSGPGSLILEGVITSRSNRLPDRVENLELPIKHTSIYDCVLRDKSLTPAAKALHCYMRTFDKEWKFHAKWLAKKFNVSRPTISKLLKELLDEGYLEPHRERQNTYSV
jgi:DNA-binding MarR family transcriptional regulator